MPDEQKDYPTPEEARERVKDIVNRVAATELLCLARLITEDNPILNLLCPETCEIVRLMMMRVVRLSDGTAGAFMWSNETMEEIAPQVTKAVDAYGARYAEPEHETT